ncbi:MAG: response regulator [Planctomycetaceae bacterium]|nr:response regulator [Planctomycetaceae bacterium]
MLDFFAHLFDTDDFPERWHCGNWSEPHGWLHIASDLAIWSAYFTIPLILVYFAARKRDLPFKKVFLLFGAFILLCGTTHLMEAVIFWKPYYRLAGLIKLATAVVSWATVFALIPNVPRVLSMRSPDSLEREVRQRTTELHQANEALRSEIRERRRIEQSLREQQERYRVTLSSIGDGVIAADAHGRVTFMNACAEQLTGWTGEEAEGRECEEIFRIVNEADGRPLENPITRALRDNTVVGVSKHAQLISRHGRRISVDDSAAPIRAENGEVRGVVLVFQDVQDRRRSERRIRFLADASEALVGAADLAGTIQLVADLAVPRFADWCIFDLFGDDGAVVRRFGEHHDPALAKTFEAMLAHASDSSRAAAVEPVLATAESEIAALLGLDERGCSYLAELRPRTLLCVPLSIRTRRLGRLIFVAGENKPPYDGEDLEASEELARRASVAVDNARLHGDLREADRRKDEFLAMLGHELRNPLAPVRNALAILTETDVDETLRTELVAIMSRQVEHLVRMVDDLLDVSRIMRGKVELKMESVSLSDVVRRAVETVGPACEERDQRLIVKIPDDEIAIYGDVVRLCQVLVNLLQNAMKYSPERTTIEVTATAETGGVAVSVRDQGMGIESGLLDSVFELFTQSERTIERAQGGLGIGLTVVRSIVEMHGGSVEARSDGPERGSEFIVRLPIHRDAAPRAPADQSDGKIRPCKVLVVEDNVGSARTLAAMLERFWKHDIRVVHDGVAAIEAAEQFLPDLIFLDIGLPGLSGYDVAKRLREDPKFRQTKLIALTGYGQAEDRRRAHEAGFDEHWVKPISVASLYSLFRSMAEA